MNKDHSFDLTGQVCAVTGAGSGIGRSIATALAAEGAVVAIIDRNRQGAEETLALVQRSGGTGLALSADVADPAGIESAHAAITARFGAPHVLVNNAGMLRPGPLSTLSLDDWNGLLAVNLTGHFLCAQVFGRAMRANRRGVLVNISSIAADIPTAHNGAYSVAKAGVSMLSRQLALEWGPEGVRSNAIHPGLIMTPLSEAAYRRPGAMEQRIGAVPSRRIGLPEDIANAVLFLASERSSYINGAEIVVDGGFTRNIMGFISAAYDRPDR